MDFKGMGIIMGPLRVGFIFLTSKLVKKMKRKRSKNLAGRKCLWIEVVGVKRPPRWS
jgi:hypothetical protein